MRGRETVSRRAHNPKVGGSTPSPATKKHIENSEWIIIYSPSLPTMYNPR